MFDFVTVSGIFLPMSDFTDEFRTWMDRNGIRPDALCERLGVERQTIANWRSNGVPARRVDHLRQVIATWDDNAHPPAIPLSQPFLIHATREQFRAWNLAALAERKTIEDWAISGLDELAAEQEKAQPKSAPALRAAEEQPPYGSSSKRAG